MSNTRNLLWLQAASCGGCTLSLLGAEGPALNAALDAAGINLLWHPALSEETGAEAMAIIDRCLKGETPLDFLCIEGAQLRGPKGSGRFQMLAGTGRPMTEWVRELAAVARYTLAVGSCASYGGLCGDAGGPTEPCGLQFEGESSGGLLPEEYRSQAGLPVVNVAGCPVHPHWVTETLLALALGQMDESGLDRFQRPRLYADHLVHHGCARNEYYEFKASAEKPSDLGCLMENLGCKGTQAHADCNTRLWNGAGSCTRGGYACINCTAPGFENPGHAFMETPKVAGIPIGLPTDMPKAWFVALAALSKSATPRRVKENAVADHQVVPPVVRKTGLK